MVRLFIGLILVLLSVSCSYKKGREMVPHRPAGVPEGAFWIPGNNNGNWYKVDYIHDHRNNASIKIFSGRDGTLIVSKHFFLSCRIDSQEWIGNLEEQISSFDGQRIYLKSVDGKEPCYLR